ncbi:hypothetical protein GALL_462800 [mine drainage metagenome]|uniref:Uncharacterized protein n=1 Tax=mine drainage metagenome TaxID=410659 RepID=A0A1J5PKM5_9ZZZZ
MDETHIQHAVSFVEHQYLHLTQIHHALLHQVKQPPGCGHQDVNPLFHAADLRVHADATKNGSRTQFKVFPVGLYRFFDLCGQLAGWREHQGANGDAAKFVAWCCFSAQFVEHGQHECRSFAGASLCTAEQIVSGQHQRNGLCLNGCGRFVALLQYGLDDGRSQIEFFKFHCVLHPIAGCQGIGLFWRG